MEKPWETWKQDAFDSQLLERTARVYYQNDSDKFYTVFVDGDRRFVPIFVPDEWVIDTNPANCVSSYTDVKKTDYDYDAIKRNIRELVDGSPGEYIWNDDVYACSEAVTDEFWFSFVKSDYYTVRTTQARLENEMYESLYENGFSVTADETTIQATFDTLNFPYRDKYYSSFSDLSRMRKRPRYVSIDMITVLNTSNGKQILLKNQPDEVTTHPSRKKTTPGTVFNKTVSSPPDPNKFIKDAVEAELPVSTDEISIELLGVGLESIRGYFNIQNLVYIHDTETSDRVATTLSEEYDQLSLQDSAAVKDYLFTPETPLTSVFGVAESIIRMQEKYDAGHETEISRY